MPFLFKSTLGETLGDTFLIASAVAITVAASPCRPPRSA